MNVCHRYKLVWWASARCASRFTSAFLSPLEFYNYDTSGDVGVEFYNAYGSDIIFEPLGDIYKSHSHRMEIPPCATEYKIIANIRNPYDRFYSNYRLQAMEYRRGELGRAIDSSDVLITFEDWAHNTLNSMDMNNYNIFDDRYELSDVDNISYLIRYESLLDGIFSIPYVDNLYNSNDVYREWVTPNLATEDKNSGFRGGLPHQHQTFRDVYTAEIATKVYSIYKLHFEAFGYDKNSWKK